MIEQIIEWTWTICLYWYMIEPAHYYMEIQNNTNMHDILGD